MRQVRVYLTLLLLLAISAAAGIIASNWPYFCGAHHWCAAGFPARSGGAELGRQALK